MSEPDSPARWVAPMLAVAVRADEHGAPEGWQYERKLDGLRCIAVRNGPEVELWSRNHLSYTARFPAVAAALGRLGAEDLTLDGELVAPGAGAGSFGRLVRAGRNGSALLVAFDLLALLGRPTTGLPLADRQSLLRRLVEGSDPPLQVVEVLEGDLPALLQRACDSDWEGLVAKRKGSPYRSGRSRDWQKIKCRATAELVLAGWTEPSGARTALGAVLVGYYDGAGRLRYAGKVGAGFDEGSLQRLGAELAAREQPGCPFADEVREKGAHWARPELVGAFSFAEWTAGGRLRHPAFQALLVDRAAHEVGRGSRSRGLPAPGAGTES
ncbi:MAG: non-homologous end-joining DNA ligase [Actinomycetota bacterium]|nr:non-homologous end-joining DNA ligase [Actinomycetota bacterium]